SLRIKEMNETGNMVYHLLTHYRGDVIDSGLSMYDCTAIGYLLEPEMYQTVDTFVDIETNGTLTAGCTVVDLNDHLEKRPNAKVALDLDEQAFKKWLLNSLENCREAINKCCGKTLQSPVVAFLALNPFILWGKNETPTE